MDGRWAGAEQQHPQHLARRIPQPLCRRDVPNGELRPQPARCCRRVEKRSDRQGVGRRDPAAFRLYRTVDRGA